MTVPARRRATMTRRAFCATAGLAPAGLAGAAGRAAADTPDARAATLIEMARLLSRAPYQARAVPLPPPFDDLDYDAYRAIRPRPGAAADLPVGGGMRADLLPPGLFFTDPVQIALPDRRRSVTFDPALFRFDPPPFATPPDPDPDALAGVGFSGLRLRAPQGRADGIDEFAVFQGASYFRAVARDTVYGLSARALALDTERPDPEEFPAFLRLAVLSADRDSVRLGTVFDSPSVSGAMECRIAPGARTEMDIALHLFARTELAGAGIAPLTSMYRFGAMRRTGADDFRPAVHDSDVLFMRNGAGETLWRPLANPQTVETSAFVDDGPRAFGLAQSRRAFADFADGEARYHRRPSALVTPAGNWGPGAVMLVEIPTRDEFHDNIVAFWRPRAPLAPGTAHRFDYRLSWSDARHWAHDLPLAPAASRGGRDPLDTARDRIVIDYAANGADDPARTIDTLVDGATAEILVDGAADTGRISGVALHRVGPAPHLRLSFVLGPDPGRDHTELRVVLRDGSGVRIAPVWLHRWHRHA